MSHCIQKSFVLIVSLALISFTSNCKAETPQVNTAVATHASSPFAKGADISWLPQMEATGYVFYNDNGVPEDCFKILKDHGINSIRLRTWVNPSNDRASGHCSKEETVAMAVRAQSWGMRMMIDFHYSDTWADPGKQVKPKAWESLTFDQLKQALYDYTFDVMSALKIAGVTPEWVQVGNEIPGGMLYPEGSNSSSWTQLIQLINKGYDAIKAVSPTSKVILHIDKGNDNGRFRWWFDNAKANGAKYDIIGMSYYPYWLGDTHPDYTLSINDLGTNLKDMANRYGKEVMVVEVGGEDTKAQNTHDMLVAVQNKVLSVPNNFGLGVFYWEPQGARSWSHYALSCWGSDGRPTIALDAFTTSTGLQPNKIEPVFANWNEQSQSFTINQDAAKITLIDISGVEICKSENTRSLSTAALAMGTYLLKVNLLTTTDSIVLKVIRP